MLGLQDITYIIIIAACIIQLKRSMKTKRVSTMEQVLMPRWKCLNNDRKIIQYFLSVFLACKEWCKKEIIVQTNERTRYRIIDTSLAHVHTQRHIMTMS